MHPVLAVNKVSGRWPVALKAAIAVAGPVAIASLLGDTRIGLMMGLGAFTVLFGPQTAGRFRIRLGAAVALGLTASALLGVVAHQHMWLYVAAMVTVAVVSSTLCVALKVGPPGPYFFILVCGVAGYLAQHGRPGGLVVGLTALGGLVALFVGMLDLIWAPHGPERKALAGARDAVADFENADGDPSGARALASQSLHHAWTTLTDGWGRRPGPERRALLAELGELEARYEHRSAALSGEVAGFEVHPWGDTEGEESDDRSAMTTFDLEQLRDSSLGRPDPGYLLREALRWPSETLLVAMRMGVATTAAGIIAITSQMAHPYWAVAFAALVLHQGGTRAAQTIRGTQRLLGTFIGLGLYSLIVWWGPEGLWVAALLFVLQFLIEILVVRNYAAAVCFITPLALTIASAAGSRLHPGVIIAERAVDSVVGVIVAFLVLWLTASGSALLFARARARRVIQAMDPVLDAIAEARVSTSRAAEQRRHLYYELLELQHAANRAVSDEPRRMRPYLPMLDRVAALGYTALGAAWNPQSARARDAAARARMKLGAITRHPISGHRWAHEIEDDVAAVEAELTDWRS